MNDFDQILTETSRVLESDTFRRSPVLARLLRYLVDVTVKGETTNSYAIAFDGLGKEGEDIADADSYARVAVARLRKALAAHYASRNGNCEIQIDPGTYQIRLHSREPTPEVVQSAIARAPGFKPSRVVWASAAALLACAAILWAVLTHRSNEIPREVWTTADLPSLALTSQFEPGTDAEMQAGLAAQQNALLAELDDYHGYKLKAAPDEAGNFVLRSSLTRHGRTMIESVMLVDGKSGTLIWTHSFPVQKPEDLTKIAGTISVAIAPANGALNSYMRRQGYPSHSPLGCWLRFTENIRALHAGVDPELQSCAHAWYEHAPRRRLASFLYGWTLIDSAASEPDPNLRASRIEQSFDVLHRAIALDPRFALLHLADMRGHSMLHHREEAIRSAREAIRCGEHNRLVIGLAASTLVFWNDPQGEQVLTKLGEGEGDAYPWEFMGLFAAAMMRDDTEAAGAQIAQLEKFNQGQPVILLLQAAYASRMGRKAEARAALVRLQSSAQVRQGGLNSVIAQLPVAPEVAQRLREWLFTSI